MKRADPSNSRFTFPHIRVDYDNEFCYCREYKKKNNQRFYNQFLYLIIFVNSDEKRNRINIWKREEEEEERRKIAIRITSRSHLTTARLENTS